MKALSASYWSTRNDEDKLSIPGTPEIDEDLEHAPEVHHVPAICSPRSTQLTGDSSGSVAFTSDSATPNASSTASIAWRLAVPVPYSIPRRVARVT